MRKTSRLAPPKLSLTVQYVSDAPNLPTRSQFRRWVKTALQRDVTLTLRIVDEAEGQELNRGFRGKDYPTNVLTFVYDEDAAPGEMIYGDVVVCAPVVAREAREQGKDLLAHYAHMTIHALLHLQGFDHEIDAEAAEMEALETRLMLELRYPDPYQET
ncbi:MAG TPA: rRNA maturation RNase YbeY [Gallionella sp.]|nr:rRNA maturation RNase YbeY [Gallionella sp.]